MRQNTLLNVRQMLKAELSFSLNTAVSTIQDSELNYLIYNRQNWLSSELDWDFLRTQVDVRVAGQYSPLPSINFERATSLRVEVFYNQIYQPLEYGIDSREYNISNFAIGQSQTPSERWAFSDENDFEVWPVSLQAQTIRFTGQRLLTTLFVNPASNPLVFDDTAKCDLDDLLIAYYACAAKLASLKHPNAQNMLGIATKRMNDLRASYPKREEVVRIRGDVLEGRRAIRAIPIVTVAPLAIPGH